MRDAEADETLMQAVARDDVAAFDVLLRRHQSAVFGFAVRLTGDTALAEDLTQECFLRVWRARRDYAPTAKFRTWLFTITRRLALDEAKRRRVPTTPLLEEREPALGKDGLGATDCNPQEALLTREFAQILEAALAALSVEQREVVHLRDVEGLRYEQIAEVIGCPIGTVKSRLNAARERLRSVARTWLEEE